tara:strand:+ start:266 stop:454 length:189 start_codon:yes stop_codon:yes gene_type:complete
MKKDNWIQGALKDSTKGTLRKKLGVKKGENIPESKLKKAEHSKNALTRKQANLAETLKSFRK